MIDEVKRQAYEATQMEAKELYSHCSISPPVIVQSELMKKLKNEPMPAVFFAVIPGMYPNMIFPYIMIDSKIIIGERDD